MPDQSTVGLISDRGIVCIQAHQLSARSFECCLARLYLADSARTPWSRKNIHAYAHIYIYLYICIYIYVAKSSITLQFLCIGWRSSQKRTWILPVCFRNEVILYCEICVDQAFHASLRGPLCRCGYTFFAFPTRCQ